MLYALYIIFQKQLNAIHKKGALKFFYVLFFSAFTGKILYIPVFQFSRNISLKVQA